MAVLSDPVVRLINAPYPKAVFPTALVLTALSASTPKLVFLLPAPSARINFLPFNVASVLVAVLIKPRVPTFETLKSVVLTPAAVEEPTAKTVLFVSPALACTESFAYGDEVPTPSDPPEVIVRADTVEVANVDGLLVPIYRFPPAFLNVQWLSKAVPSDRAS